jgi:hypothetical protein
MQTLQMDSLNALVLRHYFAFVLQCCRWIDLPISGLFDVKSMVVSGG